MFWVQGFEDLRFLSGLGCLGLRVFLGIKVFRV